jgi:hypothetical protein
MRAVVKSPHHILVPSSPIMSYLPWIRYRPGAKVEHNKPAMPPLHLPSSNQLPMPARVRYVHVLHQHTSGLTCTTNEMKVCLSPDLASLSHMLTTPSSLHTRRHPRLVIHNHHRHPPVHIQPSCHPSCALNLLSRTLAPRSRWDTAVDLRCRELSFHMHVRAEYSGCVNYCRLCQIRLDE